MAETRRSYRPSLLLKCLVGGCASGLLLGTLLAMMGRDNPGLYFPDAVFLGLVGMVCGLPVWLGIIACRFVRRPRIPEITAPSPQVGGGAAEEKKPWWLVVSAVLLLVAAVVYFIDTVGRDGTLVGRYDLVRTGMSFAEAKDALGSYPGVLDGKTHDRYWFDGPAEVRLGFEAMSVWPPDPKDWRVREKRLHVNDAGSIWWHVRRWAERAYTAIHRPRH